MNILDRLEEFLTPEHFTQGSYAVDKFDKPVNPAYAQAEKFCIMGAMYKLNNFTGDLDVFEKLITASKELYGTTHLQYLNDHLGYEAVMNVIRRAKEL